MTAVHLAFNDALATITLDAPKGNRISFAMREQLLNAFEQVASSTSRVLLLKGAGDNFCLGGDIGEWEGIAAQELRPQLEVLAEAIDLLESISIPTMAVVQGGCMGGGFELALACDFIVASKSAWFMFPEASLGIMTLQGGVYRLAERIGRTKAVELVFLPEEIRADRMATWNVVNRVVEDAQLDAEAEIFAASLAVGATDAYARTKSLMRIWRDQGSACARASLYRLSMPLFDTRAVQTALRQAASAVDAGISLPKVSPSRT